MELTQEQLETINRIAYNAIRAGGNTKADATWLIPDTKVKEVYEILQQKFGGE